MQHIFQIDEIHEVIKYAKSEVTKAIKPNFIRLHKVYFNDLYPLLGENGDVSYREIIEVASLYSVKMFESWVRNAGDIDGFQKGYIAYEVSCAISLIFPSIGDIEFFIELIKSLSLNLKDKGADTQIILSHLSKKQ